MSDLNERLGITFLMATHDAARDHAHAPAYRHHRRTHHVGRTPRSPRRADACAPLCPLPSSPCCSAGVRPQQTNPSTAASSCRTSMRRKAPQSLAAALDLRSRNDALGDSGLSWAPRWDAWRFDFAYRVGFDAGDALRTTRTLSAFPAAPPATWWDLTDTFVEQSASHGHAAHRPAFDRLYEHASRGAGGTAGANLGRRLRLSSDGSVRSLRAQRDGHRIQAGHRHALWPISVRRRLGSASRRRAAGPHMRAAD